MHLKRFLQSESYSKGMLLSLVFNGLAKGILFLLTVCIAFYFGSNIKTDIYFFIYGTMILLAGFINNIDTAVLVPVSMQLRRMEGERPAMAFLNFFLRIYLLVGIVFSGVLFFFGNTIFGVFSKFTGNDIDSYHSYFLLGSFYFIFQVLTSYINTILTSLKFFTIPMLVSGINSCIIIVGIVLLHEHFDVQSVLISGLAAYAINLLFLLMLMKKAAGWDFFTRKTTITKKVWSNIGFAEAGQLATLASSYFPLYLLSAFDGGLLSSMAYGKNVADIPNTLLTAQFANVTGIKLNEQAAQKDSEGMNRIFTRTTRFLVFILVPVSCFMFLLSEPLTTLFYKRGHFGNLSVKDTALFLKLLSVTLFSIGINGMVTRVFIAIQAIRQAFIYQVIMNVLLILAIWGFSRYYGAYGYPYGIITINGLNFFAMYIACKKIAPGINYAGILTYTLRSLLLNVIIGVGTYYLAGILTTTPLITLIICGLSYTVVLYIVMKTRLIPVDLGSVFESLGVKTARQ